MKIGSSYIERVITLCLKSYNIVDCLNDLGNYYIEVKRTKNLEDHVQQLTYSLPNRKVNIYCVNDKTVKLHIGF